MPMFIVALIIIIKLCNQPRCPSMDGRIKKLRSIQSMEFYLAIKKNAIMLFVGKWLELKNTMLITSQSHKEKYQMFYLICGNKEKN
jgi:hypothetical protein